MTDEKRKQVSKRMRFEVFKRDMFTCQYCGKKSPDVVLNADHINPVSKGGKNTITNLITACEDCNSGKSNIELSDDAAIRKQMNQMQKLAERDEQISMMVDWQESLLKSEEKLVVSAVNEIDRLMVDYSLNENGIMTVRKSIKKHGYESVIKQISAAYEVSSDPDDFRSKWSRYVQHKHTPGALSKKSLSYAKGILRNRFSHFNEKRFYAELGNVDINDEKLDAICNVAKSCSNMSEFYSSALEIVGI